MPARKCLRTIWSTKTAASISSSRKRGAPGTLASRRGRALTDINSHSIGIEIVNPGHDFGYRDFPDAQIDAVIALCRDVVARHRIAKERVLGHSDVAPARKQDPGEKFPWARLAAASIGLWVEPTPITEGRTLGLDDRGAPVAESPAQLARFGYAADITHRYDRGDQRGHHAFQRHFRPARVDGLADPRPWNVAASVDGALRAHP